MQKYILIFPTWKKEFKKTVKIKNEIQFMDEKLNLFPTVSPLQNDRSLNKL
jgi:hypothetical protein